VSSREVDAQLRTACGQGDLALVKLLLSQGADVNSTDVNGHAPLHYATSPKCVEVVNTLIEAGADLNAKSHPFAGGQTPLHLVAVKERCIEVAIALINAGADVLLTDAFGGTIFDRRNGRAVRDYYESWLTAKAISEAFASGPADDGAATSRRGLSL